MRKNIELEIFDIKNWTRRGVVSGGGSGNYCIYNYHFGGIGDFSHYSYKRIALSEEEYKELVANYVKEDLNIEALKNGFIAIEKENNIVKCSRPLGMCNEKCLLYNKCSYCVMRKLRNK